MTPPPKKCPGSQRLALATRFGFALDPEKWKPVFGKIMLQPGVPDHGPI
jgi:hypothetical protein